MLRRWVLWEETGNGLREVGCGRAEEAVLSGMPVLDRLAWDPPEAEILRMLC